MAQNNTIQDRVLLEIYLKGREMKTDELIRVTKLKRNQLQRALWRLNQRGFLKKEYEQTQAKQDIPPTKTLIVKMRNIESSRKYLSRRGLI